MVYAILNYYIYFCLLLMNNSQFDTKILNSLFDPNVRKKVTRPIVSVSIINNDKNLIGYAVIQEIEAIHIDEITFGNKLVDISEAIEKAILITEKNLNPSKKYYSAELDKIMSQINSSYCMAEILQLGNLIPIQYEDIKEQISKIKLNLEILKNVIPKMGTIIDEHSKSPDPAIQMRINMLKQFNTFQHLRIKTIESNLEASETTLKNCTNFLSFTLPNLNYSLQNKLYNVDLSQALIKYEDLRNKHQSYFQKKRSLLINLISILIGSALAYFCYSLFGLSSNVKMVAGSFFYIGIFVLCISSLGLAIHYSKFDTLSVETINILYFFFGSSLTGLTITWLDIYHFDLKILHENLFTFSLGIITTLLVIAIGFYAQKSNKSNIKEFNNTNAVVEKLLAMEKQYKSNMNN